ncbi:MAG: carboxypeptidase-like regulatory domain-containing protein [Gemmatimonadaceae bacterium]
MRLPPAAATLRWIGGICGAAWLLATPLVAQGPPPAGFEQGVFELRVGRVVTVTSPVLIGPSGEVLAPLTRVVDLTGLPASIEPGDSVRSTPIAGSDRRALLDLARREIRREGEVIPLAPMEAALVDGEIYLAPARIADWLGGHVVVDQENLVITFTRTPPFPVEQQATTRERRAAYAARTASADSARAAVPWKPRSGGLAAEWNVSLPSTQPARNASLQLQLGGALLGGGFQAGTSMSGRRGIDRAELSRSWRYAWVNPTTRWFRSVEVGNQGAATSFRSIRGVSLSNVQPFRNGFFSSVPVIPDVPNGWSYEIYQNGVLLGFSDGARQTAVPIPLYYGSTPVELRFLGPAGEEVTRSYVYQISAQQLPPRRLEYSVGAGGCPVARDCRSISFANVAYGLNSWLTTSAGGEIVDSVGIRRLPYARAVISTARGYNGRVEVTPQVTMANASYVGLGRLSASISLGQVSSGAAVASFVDPARRRHFLESLVAVPLGENALGIRSVRGEMRVDRPVGEAIDRVRAVVGVDVPRGQFGLEYERDPLQPLALTSARATMLVPLSRGTWSGLVPIQGQIGFTREGLRHLQLGTTAGNGQNRSLNASVRWLGVRNGLSLVVSYNAFLGHYRQAASLLASTGTTVATTVLGGTAIYDRGQIGRSDRFGINTAGVAGRVFFDEDTDGRYSVGDRPAAGVRVIGETGTTRTGADGTYRLWGLLPYEPTRVAIDTLQGIDLAYAPASPEIRLRPTPNVYTPIDIPLVRTRELVGHVEGWSGMPLGGIGLEIGSMDTGRRREVVTFNDGEFYVSRIPPGRYEVRIAASALEALRAEVTSPVGSIVVNGSTAEVIELPPIVLARTQRAPSSPK